MGRGREMDSSYPVEGTQAGESWALACGGSWLSVGSGRPLTWWPSPWADVPMYPCGTDSAVPLISSSCLHREHVSCGQQGLRTKFLAF